MPAFPTPASELHFVTAAQMRRIEEECFTQGMPVPALMEKAGLALTERIKLHWPRKHYPRVGVLAGPGHNGGDAAIVARELLLEGREVWVWSPFPARKPLTEGHLAWFAALGGRRIDELPPHPDLLVDGLLGFGNERAPEGAVAEGLTYLGRSPAPVVAIDLPSGLHTDTGRPLGDTTFRATRTLTLGFMKAGLLSEHALSQAGEVEVVDLGFSRALADAHSPGQHLLHRTHVDGALPRATPNSHKYTNGRALLVTGSPAYPGAAVLAAAGCRAMGTGYTVLDSPTEAGRLALARMPDIVVSENACRQHQEALERRFDAILVGPGLGGQIAKFESVAEAGVPLVVDADALALSAARRFSFAAPFILTPHEGEFARLFPDIPPELPKWERAREGARRTGAVVILKGARSVIATPEGSVFVNVASTPALARAGTGDVLAGMTTGLVARGMSVINAANAAVWIHAQAAIAIAGRSGSLSPLRLATHAGALLRRAP